MCKGQGPLLNVHDLGALRWHWMINTTMNIPTWVQDYFEKPQHPVLMLDGEKGNRSVFCYS